MRKKIWIGIAFLVLLLVVLVKLLGPGWLERFNTERQQEAQEARQSGLAFGQQADQMQCLNQALTDFTSCSGSGCTIKQGVFLKACWENASQTEGFCEDVPAFEEKPNEEAKEWAKHSCWARNIPGEGCRLLMRQRQQLCTQSD
ncbi:hypothetical protein [Nitrincola alkalilacustris]|uniref:hypothetical protein n=1 Tax=Nitrincola alkalilacustris TaxID=1571224 RepID=UPI00124BCC0C|nr:hypothetical protein [Nitrincola alkalilacustris]